MRVNSSSFVLYILLVKVILLSWEESTVRLLESLNVKDLRVKYFESNDSDMLKRIRAFYKADSIKKINPNKASNGIKLLSSFIYEERILQSNVRILENTNNNRRLLVATPPGKPGRRLLSSIDNKNSYI